MRLPTLLASSVIRGSNLGESHGGLYRLDFERGSVELVLDWNRTDIDIAGRGGDRGLRGIAFHGEHILVAANAQLLVLDQDFAVRETHTNRYLHHCHEISVSRGHVFLTATGFDSVLAFDLASRRFVAGWHLSGLDDSLTLNPFDPSSPAGPPPGHVFHINSVAATTAGFWFSGLNTPGLLHMDGSRLRLAAPLPQGTHNAQPLGDGIIYNDTVRERVVYRRAGRTTEMGIPEFDPQAILNRERFASAVARPGFARGLCTVGVGNGRVAGDAQVAGDAGDAGDACVAGGSSPSTVALYDLRDGTRLQQLNLSMDVRNAVHGLAVWPYL